MKTVFCTYRQWLSRPTEAGICALLAKTRPSGGNDWAGVSRPICSRVEQHRFWRVWAEVKPLSGLRIGVTRASPQAGELAEPLGALGARVLLVSMIGIAPPADSAPLREAASRHEAYDWI